jgi:hypothetical protein
MSEEYKRFLNVVPSPDLYDSWELVKRHMPVEQPPSAASYIVFQKGGQCYAKNGMTGHIEFGPGDASTVIQAAVNSLSRGTVLLKAGDYDLKSTILINKSYIKLCGEGQGAPSPDATEKMGVTKLRSNLDIDLIEVTPVSDRIYGVEISNLYLYGSGRANGKSGVYAHGTETNWLDQIRIYDVYAQNVQTGIYLEYSDAGYVFRCSTLFCGNGIHAYGVFNKVVACEASDNDGCGIFSQRVIASTAVRNQDGITATEMVSNNIVSHCSQYGIRVEGKHMVVEGNIVRLNKRSGISIEDGYAIVCGNSIVENNTDDYFDAGGITVWGDGNYAHIFGNNFRLNKRWHILLANGIDSPMIHDNDFEDVPETAVINDLGATNKKIYHNRGYVTENSGTATFSGNGSQTQFTIPHGLAGAPISWRVEAGSADAKGNKYVTADATNLTVTFATAPQSGTNNVVLVWQAEM